MSDYGRVTMSDRPSPSADLVAGRHRKRRLLVSFGLATVLAFSLGTVASASSPWTIFATGQDQSEYFASAQASADVRLPKALAVRVQGSGVVKVTYSLICNGEKTVSAGAVWPLAVNTSAKCNVSGWATSSKTGRLRIELLRR
jgi:hypothetical protein